MHFQLAVLGLTLVYVAGGQTLVDLRTQAKDVDFSAANTTKPFKSGTILPSVCSVGEAFFKTDAPAGANVYACASLNTWTVEGSATLAGDVTGSVGANVVSQIQGRPISASAPTSSQALVWNGTTNRWEPQTIVGGIILNGLSGAVTISGGNNNSCFLVGQTITCDVVTNNILSRATDQAGTDHYLTPAGTTCSGGGCAYVACPNPAIAAYTPGMEFVLTPDVASGAGVNTINVCTLGPITLQKLTGSSLTSLGASDMVNGTPGPSYKLTAVGNPVSGFQVTPVNFVTGGSKLSDWQPATSPVTGDATDHTVYATTIGAGVLGAGKCLALDAMLRISSGSDQATVNLYIGSTAYLVTLTTNDVHFTALLCNNPGVTNAQQLSMPVLSRAAGWDYPGGAATLVTRTASQNTSSSFVIKLTANLANTSQFTGEWWKVELQQ